MVDPGVCSRRNMFVFKPSITVDSSFGLFSNSARMGAIRAPSLGVPTRMTKPLTARVYAMISKKLDVGGASRVCLVVSDSLPIDWLFAQQERGIHPGLERMRSLLEVLEHPETGLQVVQVAGTNGKGSTTRMVSGILQAAAAFEPNWGPVGEFTSPHLFRFNERIRVDDVEIADDAIERLVQGLQVVHARIPATFFELITALALLDFRGRNARWAVLEAGLGGRLDSTTAVQANASVITGISLDHTGILGDTLEKIAFEKAGIIRPGVRVVTGANGVALKVIRARATEFEAHLWVLDEDIVIQKQDVNRDGIQLEIETPLGKISARSSLRGEHQVRNAALAMAITQRLGVPVQAIQSGLENANWPGRLELIRGEPDILLDAAHNPEGAQALVNFVKMLAPKAVTLIVAGMKDKDLGSVAQVFSGLNAQVITTRPSLSPRAALPEEIAEHYPHARVKSNVSTALEFARQITPKEGLLVVAGTIPLIAEALEQIRGLESEGRIRLQ
jgi:dihydrofolate synthase / folylpolyglutamate synthase